jgi:hypothetical protein
VPATILNATLRSDNVEGFLTLVEEGFDLHVERTGHRIELKRDARR